MNGLTEYPPRGTWWLVNVCLQQFPARRMLVEVLGGGHGNVVFEHRGHRYSADVLFWHRRMNPVSKKH